MKFYWMTPLFAFFILAGGCSKAETSAPETSSATPTATQLARPVTPTITLSRVRIPEKGWLKMFGKGFSPKQEVISHLRRPDGTEFPELHIMMDASGEFTHDIDSLLLKIGTHDLWVLDTATGVTSNVAHFEVTHDQGPTERPGT